MKEFTKQEWETQPYTGRWSDSPLNQSRVEEGTLPARYIGRRTLMVGTVHGCTLLTEGAHFLVDDDEGRAYFTEGKGTDTMPKKEEE